MTTATTLAITESLASGRAEAIRLPEEFAFASHLSAARVLQDA
jgi:virulence-associated protein VagC